MIHSIVVLGGGSAGLIAALTLKRKLPQLAVRVIRSPDIGVIGVGEGTTAAFPRHFFDYLKLTPRDFYMGAEPTWKLGIALLIGQNVPHQKPYDRSPAKQKAWRDRCAEYGRQAEKSMSVKECLEALRRVGWLKQA